MLAIATNIPMLLMTRFVVQGHISKQDLTGALNYKAGENISIWSYAFLTALFSLLSLLWCVCCIIESIACSTLKYSSKHSSQQSGTWQCRHILPLHHQYLGLVTQKSHITFRDRALNKPGFFHLILLLCGWLFLSFWFSGGGSNFFSFFSIVHWHQFSFHLHWLLVNATNCS